MRRRLTSYFDRRDRPFADDLADETLNRIGRTLEHDGAIATTPQARYCYVVARFVLLEDIRRRARPTSAVTSRDTPIPSRGTERSATSDPGRERRGP